MLQFKSNIFKVNYYICIILRVHYLYSEKAPSLSFTINRKRGVRDVSFTLRALLVTDSFRFYKGAYGNSIDANGTKATDNCLTMLTQYSVNKVTDAVKTSCSNIFTLQAHTIPHIKSKNEGKNVMY